jgi:hypothetical protein
MAITSAIVPYQANKSTATVQPKQSLSAIVSTQKEEQKKTEVTARDLRAATLRLLRKRQQRDRLEAKYYKLEKTLNERQKARKEEKKNESRSLLGSVGSGFRARARKAGGDLLGSIGKLLGFLALDWLSKPENQAIVKGIVSGVGAVFKFVDFWVTGSVDNLLSGFSQFVGGDTILERVLGFFQMAAGFFGLKYFLKPNLIIDDLTKVINFFREGGVRKIKIFLEKTKKFGLKKGLKFAFPRLTKVLEKFTGIGGRILRGIKEKLGLNKVGNLFSKIGNALLRKMPGLDVAKKAIFKLLRPVTGFLKSIPFVGGLISFGVNMLLGDPPGEAGIKAIGSSLGSWIGAGIGSIVFPGVGTFLGGLLGGLLGDFIGSRFYDLLKGKKAKQPTKEEEERMKLLRKKADLKNKYKDKTDDELLAILAEQEGMSVEALKKKLEDKIDRQGGDTSDTLDANFSANISEDERKALAVLAKYESGAAGYDAVNQYGTEEGRGVEGYSGDIKQMPQYNGRSLTDMTIAEIKQLQYDDKSMTKKEWIDSGKLHAVGRYQFIGNTLPEVAQKAGIPDNAKFTPDVQDRMAIQLIKERGISPWVGPSDKATPEERALVQKVRDSGGGDRPARIVLPKQNQRTNRMDDVSMDVIQAHMLSRMGRKKMNIIVSKQGDQVIASQTIVSGMGLNSNNTPQPVKRGI